MQVEKDRRKWIRQELDPPQVGILSTEDQGYEVGTNLVNVPLCLYVDLLNKSSGGAVLKLEKGLKQGSTFYLHTFSDRQNVWEPFRIEARWISEISDTSTYFLVGTEYLNLEADDEQRLLGLESGQIPLPDDYESLMRTRFFRSVPRSAICSILNRVVQKKVKCGERIICQGTEGDSCFIIQRGTCLARVEKGGEFHTVGRMRDGDIVGEMAILTGEKRSAHVDAETDMDLWVLTRQQFDAIAEVYPDIRSFLTEMVTDRLSSRTLTADRSVGKYLITDIIGHGGYSIVYKGVHSRLNMPVAIKMLKHDMAMDADFLDTFHKEAKTIAGFNHENIIKVYDIEELFRTVFIVMEFVDGQTIKDIIRKEGFIAFPRVVDFLIQICTGLEYAHRQGIIHRDIKAANMFVRQGDQIKILDFGLSCPSGTKNLDFPGSVPYMSPEEIEGAAVDQRTDIYALGITAYEMVVGQRPFPEDDLMALMDMHLKRDIPDPVQFRSDLPNGLRQFIFKACARDPAHRYADIKQAMGDLKPLANEFGPLYKPFPSEKRCMTTLHLFYSEKQQLALKQLMEEFSVKAQEIGVDLKAAEFREV